MARGGVINAYFDCNSPYSYFALVWLKRHREILASHNVKIDFHPVFLGGVNVGSGNKPPWTLPAKARLSKFDGVRAAKYFDAPQMRAPPFFPVMTLLPLRCMLYIKDNFPTSQYNTQFEQLWTTYWQEHKDVSKQDVMKECLGHNFSAEDISRILEGAATQKYKKMLTDQTAMLVEKGAFGAPWFLVTNGEGTEESFFGSDRFHHILMFLGVPFNDLTIVPAGESKL